MTVVGKEILDALAAPFQDDELEWRAQTFTSNNGNVRVLVLPYIESRAAMNRLDQVLGLNWKDEYREIVINGQQAFQCSISIKIDNEWITRTDGAEASDIESVKGGYSNAFKRCCVKFGISRYLYDLPKIWLPLEQKGEVYVSGKLNGQRVTGYINPPSVANANSKQSNSQPNQPSQPSQKQATQQQAQPQQTQQQRPPQQAPGQSNAQKQALNTITQLIAGLGIGENLVNAMLQHMGYSSNLRNAKIEELEQVYHKLKPVHDYTMVCKNANFDFQQVCYYAQIVLKQPVQQIEHLIFSMNYESANQAIQLVLEDQKTTQAN